MDRRLFTFVALALACSPPGVEPDSGARDSGTRRDSGTPARDAGARPDVPSAPDSGPVATIDLRDGELDVMPLGDSITLGVNGGYRNDVYTGLVAAGYDVDMVGSLNDEFTRVDDRDHEGHSGFSVQGIRDEIDTWLETDPDVVLLMIGTNDIAWWTAEPMSAVADRLEELVDHILASRDGIFVVLGTIAPLSSELVEPDARDRAALAVEYNAIVRERFGARDDVRVADVNAVLTVEELYDGVHPDEDGHADIAAAWLETLLPLLP
jgi:lysophospholipase L1-like esterase